MHQPYILTDSSSFNSVVEALGRDGMGFISIINKEGFLKGIVTDGDVRRAVLKGSLELDSLININPEVMSESCTDREIVARLRKIQRRNMPLVDGAGRLKRVFYIDDIEFLSKDNLVVIMAGGLGSRLGKLTKEMPKPMLHVGEKPMIQHLIEMFSDHGYNRFLLCVNYKKEIIKDYFGTGKDMGVEIEYVEEDQRLGTAGALSLINVAPVAPFFVINADILTSLDFDNLMDFHQSHSSVATMCVRTYNYQIPYGVVCADEEGVIHDFQEKPVESFRINAGIYVLDPAALDFLPDNEFFDMPSLFRKMISHGYKTSVYDMSDYWLDIGKVEDYEKAKNDLSFFNNRRSYEN